MDSGMNLLGIVLLSLLRTAVAQDANCDYFRDVLVGREYYIYNPNYPSNYTAGIQCRWIASCPSGYNCRLQCNDVALPSSPNCNVDRFLVSKSGDPRLTGADMYCGRGRISATSFGQRLSVGLISSSGSPGGRVYCLLDAVPSSGQPTCSCGYRKVNRIVGGQETGINEYPSMAGLFSRALARIICGGDIISPRYVLTAAHCVDRQQTNNIAVVVGEHNTDTADSPATAAYLVQSFIIHESFNAANFDYDIALVRVVGSIVFSDRVGPVCLPFKFVNTDFTGETVTLLGWGTTAIGESMSKYLQKADVTVISRSSCRTRVPLLTPRQFCTYREGKDSCQGDSGGPVLYTDRDTARLFGLGISSFGKLCGERDNPGISTDVVAQLNWIISHTPGEVFCRV